jgi:hypothetical protein
MSTRLRISDADLDKLIAAVKGYTHTEVASGSQTAEAMTIAGWPALLTRLEIAREG